jgi:hypothetical protein
MNTGVSKAVMLVAFLFVADDDDADDEACMI